MYTYAYICIVIRKNIYRKCNLIFSIHKERAVKIAKANPSITKMDPSE